MLDKLSTLATLSSMENEATELGTFLGRVRRDLGLSLRTVEAETSVSNAYLSQLETGKIKTPSPTVLHSLAIRYNVQYEHLMALAGYPVPSATVNIQPSRVNDFAARLGDVSPDEEDALVEFLSLIRKRERGRK
ncbi:helix-turn-helix domain-containing protein [Rhizobium lusitanum]